MGLRTLMEQDFARKFHCGRSLLRSGDQMRRQPGLPGSTGWRPTGAIPKRAITAGSRAFAGTPS
jgi:hypothetical protein